MKRLLLTILVSFLTTYSLSQMTRQQEIEMCEKDLTEATSDTARSRIHITLAIKYRSFDIKKAEEESDIALNLAIKSADNYYIAMALNSKGYNLLYQGLIKEGIAYAQRSVEVLGADTVNIANNSDQVNKQLAKSYNTLGTGYDYLSEHGTAIRYFLYSEDIFIKVKKVEGLAVTQNNLGISYLYMSDLEKSEEYFQKSFENYLMLGDTSTAFQAKMNIGVVRSAEGEIDEALEIYREVASEMEKIGNLRTMGHAITNIGDVYRELEQYDSALVYLQIGLDIDLDLMDYEGLSVDYRVIGEVYQLKGDFNKARENYNNALEIGFEIGSTHTLQNAYYKMYLLEKETKNYFEAMNFLELATNYKDSIAEESNAKSIGKIEAENEFNQQLAVQDAENSERLKTEAQKRRTQSIILYFTIAILVTILFFVYMVVKSLRIAREQKTIAQEAKAELELKNQEMVDSITYAKRIQTAILPSAKIVEEHLPNSFVLYEPKDIVAGDFYWLEPKDGKVIFAAADCTGHGVPGAMVSVVCNNGLNRAVREFGLSDPGKILDKTRDIVIEEFEKSEEKVKDGMDIALCVLGPSSASGSSLQYAGAHNPLWLIRKGATEIEEIKANKQPIGQFDYPQPYKTHNVDLEKGDSVYIFSDGFADQFGGDKGKKFKAANFKKLLLQIQNDSLKTQKEKIYKAFEDWRGGLEQLDDVCIIGLRV